MSSTEDFPEITVDDLIEIELLLDYTIRATRLHLQEVVNHRDRGRPLQPAQQERIYELQELQQRVRNTKTSRYERGEGR